MLITVHFCIWEVEKVGYTVIQFVYVHNDKSLYTNNDSEQSLIKNDLIN